MPVNKCLLQPDHPWHAGHCTTIGPVDPRMLYLAQARNKDAGRRAWNIVRDASDPNKKWGAHIAMTELQKFQLSKAIQIALLTTRILPIGGTAVETFIPSSGTKRAVAE